MDMNNIENLIRNLICDAIFSAKLAGMSKVDFDWAVERAKADSYSWHGMPDTTMDVKE